MKKNPMGLRPRSIDQWPEPDGGAPWKTSRFGSAKKVLKPIEQVLESNGYRCKERSWRILDPGPLSGGTSSQAIGGKCSGCG